MNSLLITQTTAISAPLAVKDTEGFFVWANSRGFLVHKAESQAPGQLVLCAPANESWLVDEDRYPEAEEFWTGIATEIRQFMVPGACAILYETTSHTCTQGIPAWVGAMVHILIDGGHLHGDLIDFAAFMLRAVSGTHDVYDAGTGGALCMTLNTP